MTHSLDWLIDNDTLGLPEQTPPRAYLEDGPIIEEVLLHYGSQSGRCEVFVSPRHDSSRRFEYFWEYEPVEILGYTVYIYELTGDDVAAYWQQRCALDWSGRAVLK